MSDYYEILGIDKNDKENQKIIKDYLLDTFSFSIVKFKYVISFCL